jgi:two-component system LytT family response regulator
LDPAIFLRLHRSAIVNLNHVAEIYREGPDEGTVVLLSGQKLKMSKTGRLKLTQLAKL